MRLFVAVELSDAVAEAALALISQLQSEVATLAPRARLTWITRDRLHITLRFIGYADEKKAQAIHAALAVPPHIEPFDLTIAGAGSFPPRRPPRVVWAGLSDGRDRLIALERLVSERLLGAGVPPEDKPYHPHLTLARVREAAGLRGKAFERSADESLGTMSVDAITLFESRLSPKGPTYVPLQRVSFAGNR